MYKNEIITFFLDFSNLTVSVMILDDKEVSGGVMLRLIYFFAFGVLTYKLKKYLNMCYWLQVKSKTA